MSRMFGPRVPADLETICKPAIARSARLAFGFRDSPEQPAPLYDCDSCFHYGGMGPPLPQRWML